MFKFIVANKNRGVLLILITAFLIACESSVMREYNHHMAGNDTRSAGQMLEQVLSQNPNSPEANYLMGNLLSRQKQYAQANTYFERSLNASSMYREHIDYLKERNFRLEFNDGLDAWSQERWPRTVQQMTYAREIFPNRIEVYTVLGDAHKELGQPEQEQEAYTSCLSYSESDFRCGLNLANSFYTNNQFREAIETATYLLEEYNQNTNLLKLIAYSHLELGDYEMSNEVFDRLIDIRFNYEATKQYATELNNKGEIYQAERYYRRCLEQMPRDKDVLSALSSIYLETGNFRLMVQANERLLSMDPENTSLKKNLMLSYELYGDIDNYRAIRSDLGLDD